MKIAIVGGTGFVGRHLARFLCYYGHELKLISRGRPGTARQVYRLPHTQLAIAALNDEAALRRALDGVDTVVHCTGANAESTAHLVRLAPARLIHVGCLYDTAPESPIRDSALDYTILRCGPLFGKGAHLLNALTHTLHTAERVLTLSNAGCLVAPVAVEDLCRIVQSCLEDDRLLRQTVDVTGPETLTFRRAVQRVAEAMGKNIKLVPLPTGFRLPFLGSNGHSAPADPLPEDLQPRRTFIRHQIEPGLADLRGAS